MQEVTTDTTPTTRRKKAAPTSHAYNRSQPDYGHPVRPNGESMLLLKSLFSAVRELRHDMRRKDAETLNSFREPRVITALGSVLGELAYVWRFIPVDMRVQVLRTHNQHEPLTFGLGDHSVLAAYRPKDDFGIEASKAKAKADTENSDNERIDQ